MPVSAKPFRISLDLAPMLFDQFILWRIRAARSWGGGRSFARSSPRNLALVPSRRRGIVSVLLTLLTLTLGCTRAEKVSDSVVMADLLGVWEHTSAMATEPSNELPRVAHIQWNPAYVVANHGLEAFELLDISLDFPASTLPGGQTMDLVKIRPVQTVEIYPTVDELREHRPSDVRDPPITIEPGARLYIRPTEALIITIDGKEFPLAVDENVLDYLGPFLRLAPKYDGYYCSFRRTLPATLVTDGGTVRRDVVQALMPVGCTGNFPDFSKIIPSLVLTPTAPHS